MRSLAHKIMLMQAGLSLYALMQTKINSLVWFTTPVWFTVLGKTLYKILSTKNNLKVHHFHLNVPARAVVISNDPIDVNKVMSQLIMILIGTLNGHCAVNIVLHIQRISAGT
ncbi:hypothetical protein ACJX0J_028345 [Zea mays]